MIRFPFGRFAMNLRAIALLMVFASVSAAAPVAAETPALLSRYRITSWQSGDGITFGAVRAIVQDGDSYIWLASDAGLVRFDGFRFATSDLVAGPRQLPEGALRAVYITRDGSLWAPYGGGRGIYRIFHGEVRDVFLQKEITGFINAMTEERSGALWVAHDGGLHRLQGNRWESVSLPVSSTPTTFRAFDVREDQFGTVWVATSRGLFARPLDGDFTKIKDIAGPVQGISEDRTGHIWITDEITGFRGIDEATANPPWRGRGMTLLHDHAGKLWVATTGQGLWEVETRSTGAAPGTIRKITTEAGLVSDELKGFLEDRDGNLWIGAIQGLSRLTPYKVRSVSDVGVVRAVAVRSNGTALVGTTSGLIELSGVSASSEGKRTRLSSSPIRALHVVNDDTAWAATDKGLSRVGRGGLTSVVVPGLSLTRISSIDSDGSTLWLCDETEGLIRLTSERGEQVSLAGMSQPVLVHVDGLHRVWIAFSAGYLAMIDADGAIHRYDQKEGLPSGRINVIYHDSSGEVWIGGEGGISRFAGTRFLTLTTQQGLPDRPVMALVDDSAGDLWMAFAMRGLVKLAPKEISHALNDPSYRVQYRVFNTSDGTAGFPYIVPTPAAKARSGALWFATTRGITILDPETLRNELSPTPGRPLIEGVTANDRRYLAVAGTELPARTGRLRIDYTVVRTSPLEQTAAANATAARIRFRYRLEGFDTDWVDGTGPRQALYTNLGPGHYRFRLQTAGDSAIWNDGETTWSFSIQPVFYQTPWFYVTCVLALALSAIGAWRFRVRQVRRQVQKELALVFGERIRLSREIHDTLMQSMFGVALQLDAASRHLPSSASPARMHIHRIRRQIEEHIAEARHSILNLRAPVLDRHDLIGALRECGDRLTAGKVPLVVTVNGTPRPCASRVETHVLRIGHEAIANAVRHANAHRVQMDIRFDDASLYLRVADDGRGFDPAQPSDGMHYGLLSMRERAADAGGRCTIESTPGGGVEVMAEFPLSRYVGEERG